MQMEIRFPGAAAVEAHYETHGQRFTIRSDQPAAAGGGGTAPAPFDLFLASIATCAGYYALRFCEQRQIDTGDLGVVLETVRDPERRRIGTIRIRLDLPESFPEKYRDALVRAVDQCAVKRHILEAPAFEVEVGPAAAVG
jgi:ribosomal protein S12 methylthiotransferase accessory factor